MFLSIKFLRFFFIIFSVIRGIFRSRFFTIWFFLELRTISFLLNLIIIKYKIIFKETIKLFLIQSLRGMRILLLILIKETSSLGSIRFLIWIVILFKIGAIPFHFWFLNLRNNLSWERIILFLTVIKFLPLMILINLDRQYCGFFRLISFIVASIRRVYYWNIKNLIVLSSLYFLGIIFYLINNRNFWLEMILIYIIIFLPLFFIFRKTNNNFFLSNWIGRASPLIIFLLIIRLAGLPPFPGFFLKYIWLINSKIDFLSLVVFFITSRIIIYLYVRFTLKNLLEISNQIIGNRIIIKRSVLFFWRSIIPGYVSIYFYR